MIHAARLGCSLAASALVAITPGAAADDARLHTFHCLSACPLGAPENDDVIVREIYTLSADPLTKMAVWVAYRITPETIGSSFARRWSADQWLADSETLEPEDYDGASAALRIDRGHQAPLASLAGTPTAADTNLLSNITPQSSTLNQGPWQRLEVRERELARAEKTAVYVLTGPLFERLRPPLPKANERHRVPSGYWKIIATADGRMTAFAFEQETPRAANYCDSRRSLDEVELRARLRLFPMRVDGWKALDLQLGCAV